MGRFNSTISYNDRKELLRYIKEGRTWEEVSSVMGNRASKSLYDAMSYFIPVYPSVGSSSMSTNSHIQKPTRNMPIEKASIPKSVPLSISQRKSIINYINTHASLDKDDFIESTGIRPEDFQDVCLLFSSALKRHNLKF